MRSTLLASLLFACAVTACTGSGQVTYSGEAQPELVEISPGVQVIADYDEPVFYSDNYYWRYDSGVWYRSHNHRGGWERSSNVPVAVRSIDRPTAYVHYHGSARADVRGGGEVRDHRTDPNWNQQQPQVRDHRTEGTYQQPQPQVRDHRNEGNWQQRPQ